MTSESPRRPAAIYCRISRDTFKDEGGHKVATELGVKRQEEDCRALAERLGYEVVHVYVENDTGASTKSRKQRPQYAEMMKHAKADDYAAIIAYSTSRLTRRTREFEDLIDLAEQHNVAFPTVVSGDLNFSTADGRAMARVVAAWDAREAEVMSERIRRQKRQAVEQGKWRGGQRPYGYEADGVTVRPEEAAVALECTRGVIAGRSLHGMVRELNERGETTSQGNPWDSVALRNMLLRPRNAGLIGMKRHDARDVERGKSKEWQDEAGPALWDAIVPEELWRAARRILSDPARRTRPLGNGVKWLGSGLYRCGVCGGPLRKSRNHSAKSYGGAYECTQNKHVSRASDPVDELVLGTVAAYIDREAPDLIQRSARDDDAIQALQDKATTISTRLAQFEADYAEGVITGRQLADATKRAEADLAEVDAVLARELRGSALGPVLAERKPGDAFRAAPLDVQRAVIGALVEVTVMPAKRGRPKGWKPGMPYTDLSTIKFTWK